LNVINVAHGAVFMISAPMPLCCGGWQLLRPLLGGIFRGTAALGQSRVGRTMTAIRQDELATELIVLNVGAYKLFSLLPRKAASRGWRRDKRPFHSSTFFISPN